MDRNGGQPRLSGLPRPSKLPMVQPKTTQLPVVKKEEQARSIKPPSKSPALRKPASTAALPRSNQLGGIVTTTSVPSSTSSRSTVNRTTNHAPRVSTSSKSSSVRASSRATSIGSFTSTVRSSATVEDEEVQDRLSRLDTFRSASRQAFQDDSPLEEFTEPQLAAIPKERKGSRPSLSDRTIESLQSVPSTPKERRQSNFFSIDSPMGPPPRPISRSSRSGSTSNSRPGTSDGTFPTGIARAPSPAKKAPASARPAARTSTSGFGFTPGGAKGRTVSNGLNNKLQASRGPPAAHTPRSISPSKPTTAEKIPARPLSKPLAGSKTVASRPPKPRPSLSNAFGSAVRSGSPAADVANVEHTPSPPTVKKAAPTVRAVSNSSSAALRQQIAAAKAAARKGKTMHDSPLENALPSNASQEIDIHSDPFNQAPKDGKHMLRIRIKNARVDGRLNIAAMELKDMPEEVLDMYEPAAMAESNVNWAEVVDLTRLIAADNQFETLDEKTFPDKSPQQFEEDEQSHQFGGLESIDLHGNVLASLPIGLRRLERLTVLNLSHNKLENSALDVISEISTLKDLQLGHNSLSANLPPSICQLTNLERLGLQSNRILGLPEALRELVSLKVLNVSGNQLTALPMEALQEVNLTELDASTNVLIGSLFPLGGTTGHPTIQVLKIANNSLAAISFSETLDLPRLRELDVTNNHLTVLPFTSGWSDIVTLIAGDNKIEELPTGFASLHKLKTANFTNNDLKRLDPRIAMMDTLDHFIVTANPLRDKKFLEMSTSDLKRHLMERLEPLETEAAQTAEGNADGMGPTVSTPSNSWSMKSNGVLDLANSDLSDAINDSLGSFLQRHEVQALHLQANKLTTIPPALWLGSNLRMLDLSSNRLGSDYLSDELTLPNLHELNLTRSGITTLEPFMTQLRAPILRTLNVAVNRLSGALPVLRATYPALTTLFAADNTFTSVTADSLRGLNTVGLTSNNIDRLPPEIGLLWDEGLRNLEIGSNAFRVPNYRVLEKGTEATLRWLRDRLPASMNPSAGEEF